MRKQRLSYTPMGIEKERAESQRWLDELAEKMRNATPAEWERYRREHRYDYAPPLAESRPIPKKPRRPRKGK